MIVPGGSGRGAALTGVSATDVRVTDRPVAGPAATGSGTYVS